MPCQGNFRGHNSSETMTTRRKFFKRIALLAGGAAVAPHVPLKALAEPMLAIQNEYYHIDGYSIDRWNELIVGVWGGLDIDFDPYSQEFVPLDTSKERHRQRSQSEGIKKTS